MLSKGKRILAAVILALCLAGCATIPITGRSQFVMVSDAELDFQAEQAYQKILAESVLSQNRAQVDRVRTIGLKIAKAAEDFLAENNRSGKIRNYAWQFNLIEDDDVINAFCLPGGKVAVYSGILRLADDDTELAVVMAHEIAHAIANHSGERMTQMLLAQFGKKTLSYAMQDSAQSTKEFLNLAYGLGTNLGIILPYSRMHENEADHIGLILMAKAGYNPRAAISFWQKMQKQAGPKAPEFLSTHPVAQTRIDNIQSLLPEALKYYDQ
jgi:predicted Zn-dependent protease